MKIAILHEMFVKLGGAEKVVETWMHMYPDADIFTLIYDEGKVGKVFPRKKIHPQTWDLPTQKVYNWTSRQRLCLPYMAESVERLDLSEYDVVLCSSSGFAHGAITKPQTKYIVYYHSPARYMWDWTHEYQRDIGLHRGWKKYLLRPYLTRLFLKNRQWDVVASQRVDVRLANSYNTQTRIAKYYDKTSEVLYPPVNTDRFSKSITSRSHISPFQKYYIIISALTEFKRVNVAIEAFNHLPEQNLLIIGTGDHRLTLEGLVQGSNIKFIGPQYGDDLVSLVQQSLGLIFPGEEDFGIVPIEVMAAGKPVFALGAGGLLETVVPGETGMFFMDKDGHDFIDSFRVFHDKNMNGDFTSTHCKKQAEKFSQILFIQKITHLVEGELVGAIDSF